MKPRFILSPEAARDIREIWSYIADDSIRAARRVRLQLLDACQGLAENPLIGHSREDVTAKPVLFWPIGGISSSTIPGRDQSRSFESCTAPGIFRCLLDSRSGSVLPRFLAMPVMSLQYLVSREKELLHASIFSTPIPALATADLQELLHDQAVENARLEFKREIPGKDEMLKKLSSFANTFGGYLVVGAEAGNDGRITGLPGVELQPRFLIPSLHHQGMGARVTSSASQRASLHRIFSTGEKDSTFAPTS